MKEKERYRERKRKKEIKKGNVRQIKTKYRTKDKKGLRLTQDR
jgi:hypothetical protein